MKTPLAILAAGLLGCLAREPAAAGGAQCTLTLFHGVSVGQGHFVEAANSSVAACCALCEAHQPRCLTFVLNNDTHFCFLMDNQRPGVRQGPEMTTGCVNASCAPKPPPPPPPPGPPCTGCANVMFFITDDQDYLIGGWDDMPQTKRLIGEQGVSFSSWRIHTPICAVSRSALQSGRYIQNIKSSGFPTPVKSFVGSGAVGHVDFLHKVAPVNFGVNLAERGYTCGVFGKWMNGFEGVVRDGKAYWQDVAPGCWNRWFTGTGYGNSSFVDSESPTGKYVSCPPGTPCAQSPYGGYSTTVIGNKTAEWIRGVVATRQAFFAYVGVTAPHLPSTPPLWYANDSRCSSKIAPRHPNWNYTNARFHSGVANLTAYTPELAAYVDRLARQRCGTLLAVDDTVAGLVAELESLDVMSKTYFVFTSDHGYNLGHHRLPDNKFNAYEHSIRIPLLIRGPGISPGSTDPRLGTQVDLAPTFLSMAGAPFDPRMDGRSLLPGLVAGRGAAALPAPTLRRHDSDVASGLAAAPWRKQHLTVWYNHIPRYTVMGECEDDWSNTYLATFATTEAWGPWKLAVFDPTGKQTGFALPNHFELFNMTSDPYELDNVWAEAPAGLKAELNASVYRYYGCRGSAPTDPMACL